MTIIQVEYEYIKNNWKKIQKIINIYFPNCDFSIFKKEDNEFFVIIHNNDITGFFNIFKKNRIQKFCIFPQYRNQGIGSNIIHKIIQHIQNKNQNNIQLFVKKDNNKAINFWKKNNFIITNDLGNIIEMNLYFSSLKYEPSEPYENL